MPVDRRWDLKRNSLLSTLLAFDRHRWLPNEASRCTAGVAITFGLSIVFHNPAAGLLASLGALYTGLAASNGVYHARVRTMVTSGLMIGAATAMGTLVGRNAIASLSAVLVVAFVTALYASASRVAGTIAAQTTAILCVIVGLRLPPTGAVQNGLLVCSGSVVQLFLLTLVWPMKPGLPESRAVAEAYEGLARFVLSLKDKEGSDAPLIPNAVTIQDARSLLSEAETYHRNSDQAYLVEALRRAEALRAALVGFAEANRNFALQDRKSRVRSHRVLRTIARCLQSIGERALSRRLALDPVSLKIPAVDSDTEQATAYRNWLQILAELIQDCCFDANVMQSDVRIADSRLRHTWSLFTALTRLPDIGSLRSVTLLHAIRYAVTVEIAVLISFHWARSHSYWLPVTVAVILRQDYGLTFQRGIARLVGTLLGLALAIVVVDIIRPNTALLQVLTIVMTWFAFASVQASYVVMTVAITGYVVYSISLSGALTEEASSMRFYASLVGVCLAVASFVLWPAWNWAQIWETLRVAAEAQATYVKQIMNAKARTPAGSVNGLEEALVHTRALRIQSEYLVEVARRHPLGRNRAFMRQADQTLVALEENAATILVAQSEWNTGRPGAEERLKSALARAEELRGLTGVS